MLAMIMRVLLRLRSGTAGYSLIQIAIAVLIIGLLMAPAAFIYSNYKKEMAFQRTYKTIQYAVDSLQNQRRLVGAYPCPAPLNALRNDINYGRASNCRAAPIAAMAPGDCAAGICIEQSTRASLANRRVVVGAVPFRTLQLDEKQTIDGYGARLVYAVTESFTDEATFNEGNGGIEVIGQNGQSVVNSDAADPGGTASFLIISHGPTSKGGYTLTGGLIDPCMGPERDMENCNIGFETGTAVSPDAVYNASYENSGTGAAFFDDQLMYFSQISSPLWKRTTADENDIEDLSPNFTGVGTQAPATQLHITSTSAGVDSLRVTGQVIADTVCDENGLNCFPTQAVAGDLPDAGRIACPPGEYLIGVQNGAARCAPDFDIVCPPATPVLRGIDASNQPICAAMPVNCPAQAMNGCAPGDINLPVTADGGLSGPYAAGTCRQITYRCNGGAWAVQAASGFCNPAPVACPCGYSGTYNACTGVGSCACAGPATCPETTPCAAVLGAGWAGLATRDHNYDAACVSSYVPPAGWDTSACNCPAPVPPNRVVGAGACPPGYTGSITQAQTFNTVTCAWENSGPPVDSCACDLTPIVYQQDHVCADPVCEQPDPADRDQFTITINPADCTQNAPVMTYTGSCDPRTFTWVDSDGTDGSTAVSYPPGANMVGESCTCADHQSTTAGGPQTCFQPSDPTKTIYKCRCN